MLAIAALTLAVAACISPSPSSEGSSSTTYYVREGMVNHINPPIEAIWNMQVEVMDDYGNFDPDLMTAEHWAALYSATNQLALASPRMADADTYIAADPNGNLAEPPMGTDLVAIQGRLDTNGGTYKAFSQAVANHADQLVAAVNARDTEEVTRLVNDMQPVCKACHDVFWYPEEYQAQ